jgi:hypothetical protein
VGLELITNRRTQHSCRLTVGGKTKKLALTGSDIKVKLTSLPSSGGSACFDFSKGWAAEGKGGVIAAC